MSFLNFSEAADVAFAFLRSSALSDGEVADLGDAHLRESLAEEETHLYFEVLWAATAGFRLRSDFLPGVFLPGVVAAAADDNVEAAVALTSEGDGGFSSTPPTPCLLFTHVNWDVLGKVAPTLRRWLLEGCFDGLTSGADNGVATLVEVDGVAASWLVLQIVEGFACRRRELMDEAATGETSFCFSSTSR